jgi:hypothetical protein
MLHWLLMQGYGWTHHKRNNWDDCSLELGSMINGIGNFQLMLEVSTSILIGLSPTTTDSIYKLLFIYQLIRLFSFLILNKILN